jgi:hypothetical protein
MSKATPSGYSVLTLYPFPSPRPVRKPPTDAALDRIAERARAARLATEPPPTPGQLAAYVRGFKTSRVRESWSYGTRVIRWMGRCGLRTLREAQKRGRELPTADVLAAFLAKHARLRGHEWIVDDAGGERVGSKRIADSRIDGMAHDAARYALSIYDPEVLARAVRGGKSSKPPTRFTLAMLDALPVGLSKRQQAEALRCSESTVADLRRQQRERVTSGPYAHLLDGIDDLLD